MTVSNTREGMRNYRPRRPNTTLKDVITPEIRAKRAKMIDEARLDNVEKSNQKAAANATPTMKKGGTVAKYARGGGIEQRGKTRGKIC